MITVCDHYSVSLSSNRAWTSSTPNNGQRRIEILTNNVQERVARSFNFLLLIGSLPDGESAEFLAAKRNEK